MELSGKRDGDRVIRKDLEGLVKWSPEQWDDGVATRGRRAQWEDMLWEPVRTQHGYKVSYRNGVRYYCKARHNTPEVLTGNRTRRQMVSEEGRPAQLP